MRAPVTYDGAHKMLGSRESQPLAPNTSLHRYGKDLFGVRFHQTRIITIHPGNTFTLDSGRYQGRFTLDRLNRFSPAEVFQIHGVWFVRTIDSHVPFEDGMIVDGDGQPLRSLFTASHTALEAMSA